jgi:tetratricopeptide (TPR) repeat protein
MDKVFLAMQGFCHRLHRLIWMACLSCMLSVLASAQTIGPAPLPPEAVEGIKKGILAAKQQDYLLATRFFQDARKIAPQAPEIYYDLGLAESKIPGRELRAIAWFGAYLAANPNAPNAAAVKDQIDVLEVKSQSNISRLIQTVQDAAIKIPIGDPNAWPIPGTYHHDLALAGVARLWARSGDFEAAKNALGSIVMTSDYLGIKKATEEAILAAHQDFAIDKADVGDIAGAQRDAKLLPASFSDSVEVSIAEAQAKAGDIPGAFKTVDSIHDTAHKNWALGRIADVQTSAGDITSALKTIDLNPQLSNKSGTLGEIAERQVKAGDIAGALRTASLIPEGSTSPKEHVYSSIAEAQITAGDTGSALKTVEIMHDEQLRSYRLSDIVKTQAKKGDIVSAQQTVGRIVIGKYTTGSKCDAQIAIAEAQATEGDIVGARKTLAAAQMTADGLEGYEKDSQEVSIAGAQASAGDILGAFKTADSVHDGRYKNWALERIAKAQARAGDTTSALKTADLTQDAEIKSQVQGVIADAQTKTRSTKNRPAVVTLATVKASSQPPAISAVQVSNWLKRLDDSNKTNDCALNTGPFLDLASYLKSLPSSNTTQEVFETLHPIVSTIVKAHHDIDKMLKQQGKK